MCDGPGYSVYISRFEEQRDQLVRLYRPGSRIFTSFHVSEEFDGTYTGRAKSMCDFLKGVGYTIVGDVSRKTLSVFGETDIVAFAGRMGISILRIDYGFSVEEIGAIGARMPVCLNASTLSAADAQSIRAKAGTLYAMHNFYPRPETGLDAEFFDGRNRGLEAAGVSVMAFIPGGGTFRGPLFLGLPTLEKHRGAAPSAAFVDMAVTHGVGSVFVGDGVIPALEADRIASFLTTGIIDLPVVFDETWSYLYDTVYTVRPDSPSRLMRLQESREYSMTGKTVEPFNCVGRGRGAVTLDNKGYLRYSGELQVIREPLDADGRVNVIGEVPVGYRLLLDNCPNGKRLRFVRP